LVEQVADYSPVLRSQQAGVNTKEIMHNVVRNMARIFGSTKYLMWTDPTSAPPIEMRNLKWQDQPAQGVLYLGEVDSSRDDYLLFAPIRSAGRLAAMFGIVVSKRPEDEAIRVLGQLCRVGEILMKQSSSRARSRLFSEIVSKLAMFEYTEGKATKLALDIATVLECDRCTIFGIRRQEDVRVLTAFGSAPPDPRVSEGRVEYELGQGLTGWVGKTAKEVVLDSALVPLVEDSRWGRRIEEKFVGDVSSFVGMPIIDQTKGEVVGVISVYRLTSREMGKIPQESIDQLRTISNLLGLTYGRNRFVELDDTSSPPHTLKGEAPTE
jgi:hypothetical protein